MALFSQPSAPALAILDRLTATPQRSFGLPKMPRRLNLNKASCRAICARSYQVSTVTVPAFVASPLQGPVNGTRVEEIAARIKVSTDRVTAPAGTRGAG